MLNFSVFLSLSRQLKDYRIFSKGKLRKPLENQDGFFEENRILSAKWDDSWYLGESWAIALFFRYGQHGLYCCIYHGLRHRAIDYVSKICNTYWGPITNYHIKIVLSTNVSVGAGSIAFGVAFHFGRICFCRCSSLWIHGTQFIYRKLSKIWFDNNDFGAV